MNVVRALQRGFSLLEILVAFSILALSLGVLMQIFSGSLRNADTTRDQAQAVTLAQSLLASAGVEGPLAAGETSGVVADKFRWTLRASPFAREPGTEESASVRTPVLLDLWEVSVKVAWGGESVGAERAVTLNTLRAQQPVAP